MGEIKSMSEPVWLRDIFLLLSILFHSLQLPSQAAEFSTLYILLGDQESGGSKLSK